MWKRFRNGLLFAFAIIAAVSTVSCSGNVYVGVGVAGPYYGHPYRYPYPFPVGGVVIGRPYP